MGYIDKGSVRVFDSIKGFPANPWVIANIDLWLLGVTAVVVFMCSAAAVPVVAKSGGRGVIAPSSDMACTLPAAGISGYNPSKCAMVTYMSRTEVQLGRTASISALAAVTLMATSSRKNDMARGHAHPEAGTGIEPAPLPG